MTRIRTNLRSLIRAAPLVLTTCLLAAVAVDRLVCHVPPAESASYHQRVRDAALTIPYHIGPWLGSNVDVPESATAMLHPNIIVSRSYRHVVSGQAFTLLLVHCEDARDLLGHYPPVCYVSHGWTSQSARPMDWEVDGMLIPAMRYKFMRRRNEKAAELCIENFMILPDGQFCRDMDGIEAAAQDYRRKFFGAAQLQLVFDAGVRDADREHILRQFVLEARPLLDAIRSGVTP